MEMLSSAVGRDQENRRPDVAAVQTKLNRMSHFTRRPHLRVDGRFGSETLTAILSFQKLVVRMRHPDGVVTSLGPTWALLCDQQPMRRRQKARNAAAPAPGNVSLLTEADFKSAAARLGPNVSPLIIHAFAKVESGGKSGFGSDGRPIIAFEGHRFRYYTDGKYDEDHPDISYKYKEKAGEEWKKNNKNQKTAWAVLETAAALDHDAALKSCSWGMFQVMGSNYESCGYDSVDDFVNAMKSGQKGHLEAFVGYCLTTAGMTSALEKKNYVKMASLYNGKDYGDYDKRIEKEYKALGGK